MTGRQDASFYDLLEVGPNATIEEIQSSYQRIQSYLGDGALAVYSMLEEDELASRRALVEEAYRTLSDPERREAYDRARESGSEYPDALVAAAESDATMSVEVVQAAEEPVPTVDVDAIFRGGDEPERVVTPARLVPPAPDDDEDGDDDVAPAAPAVEVAPPAAPRAAIPHAGRRPAPPREAPRPSLARRSPPPPPRPPGIRRLHPSAGIELSPDTEYSGALLRRLRESCHATLAEVADITKVRRRYLEGIEEQAFDELPAAVYVRGFVTEYARVLGLDTQKVANSYMAIYRRYRGEGT